MHKNRMFEFYLAHFVAFFCWFGEGSRQTVMMWVLEWWATGVGREVFHVVVWLLLFVCVAWLGLGWCKPDYARDVDWFNHGFIVAHPLAAWCMYWLGLPAWETWGTSIKWGALLSSAAFIWTAIVGGRVGWG